MNTLVKTLLVFFSLTLLLGCAVRRPMRYDMSDVQASKVLQLKYVVLNVEPFADERRSVSQNGVLFTDDRKTTIDGKSVCINSEKDYKPDVGRQIASTVAAHFKQKGAYKDVLIDSKPAANYSLQGSIRQFYGQQDYTTSSAIGSGFGLVGALATIGATTPGIVRIQITDLNLIDQRGTIIKTFADINESYNEEFRADSNCLSTHVNVLYKLKAIVEVLSAQIEQTLVERETKGAVDHLETERNTLHNP